MILLAIYPPPTKTFTSSGTSIDAAIFKAPICFLTNHDNGAYHRSDAEWKRATFPQETM